MGRRSTEDLQAHSAESKLAQSVEGDNVNRLISIVLGIVVGLSITPTVAQQSNPNGPSNTPYSSQNNPNNTADPNQYGGRNATYDNEGTYNGYTVPEEGEIGSSPDGKRARYMDEE